MMFEKDYDAIIREHFDLSDKYTRQYILSLDEGADRAKILTALSSSLYDNIVNKVDDIDFGTIPMSRGDITKVEKFNMTEESLSIIRKLALEYKQNPAPVDTITTAIQNVKDNKSIFMKGYALNVELPMLLYNLVTLSIIRATSMIIATCVNYISDPKTKTLRQALDKVAYKDTQNDVMFEQLTYFNSICKDGSLVKILTEVIKNNKKVRAEAADFVDLDPAPEDATDPIEVTDEEVPAPVDDAPEEPINAVDEPQDAPSQEPVPGTDVTDTPPQSDQLYDDQPEEPVADTPVDAELPQTEPVADEEPQDEPPVQDANPDVNPNPETDPDLAPSDAPIVEDPNSDIQTPTGAANPSDDGGEAMNDQPSDAGDGADVVRVSTIDAARESASLTESLFGDAPYDESVSVNEGLGELAIKAAAQHPIATAFAVLALSATTAFIFRDILVKLIRNLIYTAAYTSMKISDYWAIQAELIEANADELELSSDMDEEKKAKVIKKQRKWAERFRKWSNIFNIDRKNTDKKVKEQEAEDKKNKKKVKQDDNGEDVLF